VSAFNNTNQIPQAESVSGLSLPARRIEVAGAIAGIIGGAAMAIVGAVLAFAMNTSIWLTPERIAAFVLGPGAAATPEFDAVPVLVGTLIHFILSAIFGIIFALLVSRGLRVTTEYGAPVVAGLVYGGLIWLVAYFIILPILNPLLLEVYAPSFIMQNLVYGTVLGLAYMLVRPETYTYVVHPLGTPATPSRSAR